MGNIIPKEDKKYNELLQILDRRIEKGVQEAVTSVVKSQLGTYWDVGRYIVEFEQGGNNNSEYGQDLLRKLSKDLTAIRGKGYSRSNLYLMRKFYILFPDGYEGLEVLSWSHITELVNISDDLERKFYTNECCCTPLSLT